jgi:hypothetical protein
MQSDRVTSLAYDGSGRTEARGGEVGGIQLPSLVVSITQRREEHGQVHNAVGYIHYLLGA